MKFPTGFFTVLCTLLLADRVLGWWNTDAEYAYNAVQYGVTRSGQAPEQAPNYVATAYTEYPNSPGGTCTQAQQAEIDDAWDEAIKMVALAENAHLSQMVGTTFTPTRSWINFISMKNPVNTNANRNWALHRPPQQVPDQFMFLTRTFQNIRRYLAPDARRPVVDGTMHLDNKVIITCFKHLWLDKDPDNPTKLKDDCIKTEAMTQNLSIHKKRAGKFVTQNGQAVFEKRVVLALCPEWFQLPKWEVAKRTLATHPTQQTSIDHVQSREHTLIHEYMHFIGIMPTTARDIGYLPQVSRFLRQTSDMWALDANKGRGQRSARFVRPNADSEMHYITTLYMDQSATLTNTFNQPRNAQPRLRRSTADKDTVTVLDAETIARIIKDRDFVTRVFQAMPM